MATEVVKKILKNTKKNNEVRKRARAEKKLARIPLLNKVGEKDFFFHILSYKGKKLGFHIYEIEKLKGNLQEGFSREKIFHVKTKQKIVSKQEKNEE